MINKYIATGRVNAGPALVALKPNIDHCHPSPAIGRILLTRHRHLGAAAGATKPPPCSGSPGCNRMLANLPRLQASALANNDRLLPN